MISLCFVIDNSLLPANSNKSSRACFKFWFSCFQLSRFIRGEKNRWKWIQEGKKPFMVCRLHTIESIFNTLVPRKACVPRQLCSLGMQPTDKGTYSTFKSLLFTVLKVRVNENQKSQEKGREKEDPDYQLIWTGVGSQTISESSVDSVQAKTESYFLIRYMKRELQVMLTMPLQVSKTFPDDPTGSLGCVNSYRKSTIFHFDMVLFLNLLMILDTCCHISLKRKKKVSCCIIDFRINRKSEF